MVAKLHDPVPASDVAPPARRYRGKNKKKRWTRSVDIELAVIRLPLDVHDPATRHRTEDLFSAMWSVKRALQRDVRDAVDAYWVGDVRRDTDAKAWRLELGLSREGMERRAYRHMEKSQHLAHHVTKALVMHQADEVFETAVSRHLFPDSSGCRFGRPKVGRWWDYTRIPGRARSHTTSRKWETFRLHGTLAGHLDAYRHRSLDRTVTTPEQVAELPAGIAVLAQPRHLPTPMRPLGRVETGEVTAKKTPKTRAATWWDHTGPLAVVFTGGADSRRGALVLPVRLPSGSGRWPRLMHFLNSPDSWHKIDLVRRRDASAPGGWAYEAHLMVLAGGYASPATKARRQAAAARERVGGIDGVSNLSVVSFPHTFAPADGGVEATRIAPSDAELAALAKARRKDRGRKRALDRSRRASNSGQYQPSKRQQARADRRQAAGLPARTVETPGGARAANKAGVPKRAYRRDSLSAGYRFNRARLAEAAATQAAAKDHRARRIAEEIISGHGANLVVEDCDIRTWYRRWGKALQATTPGRLIAAIGRECEKTGGRMLRASTFNTKLSQTCFCGEKVAKTLAVRIHACPACELTGDRDKVSAALCAHVHRTDPEDPSTARLDIVQARHTQILFHEGLQEALSSQPQRGARPTRGRTHAAATKPDPSGGRPLLGKTPPPGTGLTPNETRPANERHKAHVGTVGCTDNAPLRRVSSVQTSGGHHSIT